MTAKFSPEAYAPPRVVITAENTLIENAEGISSFSSDEIAVRIHGGIIILSGSNIFISAFEDEQLSISGKIRTVTFHR